MPDDVKGTNNPNANVLNQMPGRVDIEEETRNLGNPEIAYLKSIDSTLRDMAKNGIVIIATGPLTSEGLAKQIQKITGQDKLYFYDAAAPIISKDSINFDIAFYGDRYSQE